jgi:hypothetical protein
MKSEQAVLPNPSLEVVLVEEEEENCPIILACLLQHLMNAEYLIGSWSITFKSTLIFPNNFIQVWS